MVHASFLGANLLSWALVLVFMGGAGKSAMFPLHIWLPDAMEGPTPVSALIHAATMVVAGVYLVARLFPIYAITGVQVLHFIAWVGAITALIAALIACTQTDIKRVLAYSTMSQIGYMMLALGVAGWGGENSLGFTASLFHLFTHAFFKALLFLGAGMVIHFIHSNDMRDMGGLRKYLPVTHLVFLLACLSIAGVPPFAGFFSKEEILTAAWHGNPAIFYIALITAGITAFYMFRLYFSIFWNKTTEVHGHGEGGFVMKLPLIILAIGAVAAGFVPFGKLVTADGAPLETSIDLQFSAAPVLFGLAGIFIAYRLYFKPSEQPQKIATAMGGFYQAAYRKFYIDEIYLFITQKIIFNLIGRPAAWFDKHVVDGLVNGVASLTAAISSAIKKLQSGKVQAYGLYFFAGVLGLALLVIYVFNA
jgi:NADH-quinone oxidoreductase subunit L